MLPRMQSGLVPSGMQWIPLWRDILSTPIYGCFFPHWFPLWESAVKKMIPFKLFTCKPYDFRGNIKTAIKFNLISIKPQSNHVKIYLNENPQEWTEEEIVSTSLFLAAGLGLLLCVFADYVHMLERQQYSHNDTPADSTLLLENSSI